MERYKFNEIGNKEEFEMVRRKHPDLPKSILVKTDLCRRGTRFTETVLEDFNNPESNFIPQSVALFSQSKSEEPVAMAVPGSFRLNDGTLVFVQFGPKGNDPYIIDKRDGNYVALFNDGSPLAEVSFVKKPEYYGKKTSGGTPMEFVASCPGSTFVFCPNSYCGYWKDGKQCVFCDIVYNAALQVKAGKKFKTRRSPQDFYDVTKEALKEKGRFLQGFVTGGSNPEEDFQREFEFELEMLKAIQQACRDSGYERPVPIFLIATVLEPERMQKLKDGGATGFGSYVEVWDKEKFKNSCPGKAERLGWDTMVARSLEAVKIFGRGNVSFGFVPGLEMAPEPYGFGDNMEAALKSTLSGYEFLLKNGIALCGTNLGIKPGTILYKIGMTPVPLEFYARLELGRLELQKTYRVASKVLCWRGQPYGLYADCCRYI